MKRLLLVGSLLLAVAQMASGQGSYTNATTLNAPPNAYPQIDATNFVNLGPFNMNVPLNLGFAQFDFSDVLTFTNRSTMTCNTGFIFDNAPSSSGLRSASASFGNANQGVIAAGSVTNGISLSLVLPYVGFLGDLGLFDLPELDIYATNIVNTGLLDVGLAGVMVIGGNHVDLSKGSLHVEGFDEVASDVAVGASISNIIGTNILIGEFNANSLGIFNAFQGIGSQTNVLSPFNFTLPFPSSPFNLTTNATGLTFGGGIGGLFGAGSVVAPNATPFVFVTQINASNTGFQVVFINTNLPGISTDVRFAPGGLLSTPTIQWTSIITNHSGVPTATNKIYLSDAFGSNPTNFLVTNSFTLSGVPVLSPYNYSFFRSFPGYTNLPIANRLFDTQTIFTNMGTPTNAYSAFEVNVADVAFAPDGTAAAEPLTNLPGRITILATNWLDLTRSKITGPNYISISAPNHFVGSANASIVVPNMDIDVGSTNGLLTITNLVAPSVPRINGPIDMWSGRWTNTFMVGTNGPFTNTFHVWIVDSGLVPAASSSVLNFTARSTNSATHQPANVIISDVLNITNSLLIQAENLTVTTNDSNSPNPFGEINFFNQTADLSASFPILQNLTNFGTIIVPTSANFSGATPYLSFVNHGLIAGQGANISANYVENTSLSFVPQLQLLSSTNISITNNLFGAILSAESGAITVQAGTALLTNDVFGSLGDQTLTANDLIVIDHIFDTGGALTLSVSNSVMDGGMASSNFWFATDGFNLLVKPRLGDFLGTTIELSSPAGSEVNNTLAGLDLGPSSAGFTNNGALGRLVLDGEDNLSQFFFGGLDTTVNYALYVDQIVLVDGATNRATSGNGQNFTAFDLPPNFKIYYADAMIGNNDISEKLQQGNNHQLVWVPSFAGIFSGTNLVSGGVTNLFNRALVQSADIDSNGNGVANAFDPNPFFTPDNVNLTLGVTNSAANPAMKIATISWSSLAKSTNTLYYTPNLMSTNWVKVFSTNMGPLNGPVTVRMTNSAGFYRVKVNPPQP